MNDPDGDCGTTLGLLFGSKDEARRFMDGMKENGIALGSPIDSGRHVYVNWEPVLEKRGARVDYFDPHIPLIIPTREHGHWTGRKSVRWSKPVIHRFDAVVISTAHQAVNYAELAAWAPCIIDTRNAMAAVKTKPGQVWKA